MMILGSRRAALFVAGGVAGGVFGVAALGLWALPALFPGRILPGVSVSGVSVGRKAADGARAALEAAISKDARVHFAHGDLTALEPTLAEIGASPDVSATVASALAVGRQPGGRGILERFRLLGGVEVPAQWIVDRQALQTYLELRFSALLRKPSEPSWELEPDGSFAFGAGTPGVGLPMAEIADAVETRLARGSEDPVPIRLVEVPPAMSDADARVAGSAVARVLATPLTLITAHASVVVSPDVLASWVRSPSRLSAGAGAAVAEPELDRAAIERYLQSTVAARVARPPRDAQFDVQGSRATTFVPPEAGVELVVPDNVVGILRGLAAGADRIKLVTKAVPPRVAETPLMAQYGIRAIVARGESDFAGSPKNRVHNIRVGSEKYHGLLIPPGQEFSFNTNLGPVDKQNGFLPELVILANVTTPQYGGGLCQVSTTMFRSAINAGLPITARKNHAYAVSYYGVPGFDATIYPPNPDLRFVNDTPGHLLIQMKLEGTKLAFEFWGTPDGRQVEVLGPYPYDRQKNGALKATLVRKITRAGETTRDEWHSNYKSPKLFPKVLAANAERETWEDQVARIAEKDRQAHEAFERKKAELLLKQQGTRNKEPGTPRPTPTPTPTPTPASE